MSFIRKYWIRVTVLGLALHLLLKGIIPGWEKIETDFPNYFVSAQLLAKGEQVVQFYDYKWFNEQIQASGIYEKGNFGPFPPLTATLFLPLTLFEPMHAKRIWLIINLFLLYGVIILVKQVSDWNWLKSTGLILGTGIALSTNIRFGQVYLLILFLMLLVHLIERKGPKRIAGPILGVISVFKYYPSYILAVYTWRKNGQLVLWSFVTVAVLLLGQWIGFQSATEHYYGEVLPAHLFGKIPGQSIFAVQFQSWNSFLSNLFVYDSVRNANPMVNWGPGKYLSLVGIYSALLFGTLYLVKLSKKAAVSEGHELEFGLIGIALMTILPASGSYHFLMLAFPVLMLLKKPSKYAWILLLSYLLLGLTPVGWIVSKSNWPLPFLYPRLWLINFILIISWAMVWDWSKGKISKTAFP